MKVVEKSVIRIEELVKKQPLTLSGATVQDGGHCKYCLNVSNYSN